ncbi:MAG: alcohol dehydrogenase catalytic domain-containing protein [Planctomycetes bacterium]|nr:alcohol dehydrogenase catalytic domain-containing protein [Planctomycetota bacterium]
MRAVVLDNTGVKFRSDYPNPQPKTGEILVRVLMAGVCETDLQLIRGYMGFQGVLGHEFVGIAESGPFQGRRVVGEINASCETCEYCQRGLANHCPHRTVLGILNRDGAFADYLSIPQQNLHLVPDDISTRAAVLTEPLAAAFQILEQLRVSAGQTVLVLGDGRLGNLCAQVLAHAGCRVTVVGKHARKLEILRKSGIATLLLADLPADRSNDIVVDCTGSATGLATALSVVRPRGTIVLKTTVAGEQHISLAPVVIDEVTIIGSRCGPFPVALAALQRQQIDVMSLIDGIAPLESTLAMFERARTEPVLKLLLEINSEAA